MPRPPARCGDALDDPMLVALTEVIDRGLELRRGDPARLVRVRTEAVDGHDADELELGFRPVEDGRHPFDDLVGFVAPGDWAAIGVAATGRARPSEGGAAFAVRSVHLVARSGAWASCWRPLGDAVGAPADGGAASGASSEPPTGRVDDTLRRTLGLPTPPPPADTRLLWALQWLDALLAVAAGSATGRRRLRPLRALAAAHPAVRAFDLDPSAIDVERLVAEGARLAAWRDWPQLRRACAAGTWTSPEVPPPIAAWLDDGSFARWVLAGWPELADLRGALDALLAPSARAAIDAALAGWDLLGGLDPPVTEATVTDAGEGGQ